MKLEGLFYGISWFGIIREILFGNGRYGKVREISFGNGRYGNVREIFRTGMDGTGMYGKFFIREWTVREVREFPYRTGNFPYRGNTNPFFTPFRFTKKFAKFWNIQAMRASAIQPNSTH
jgi:hypothetical protein